MRNSSFHLPADDLNLAILKSIKEAFKGKYIVIIVFDSKERSTSANDLLKRIENIKKEKNTITFGEDNFLCFTRKNS